MIYVDVNQIMRKYNIPNKYVLTMLIAKRARALSEDASKRLFGGDGDKPINTAIEEIKEGKVVFVVKTKNNQII
ncbi:DNA-directed RNA polymerase subunit omega [Acetomicrobium hydrogeniformans]|uniref:DNA-directed RNA polymerase subunit omega n=1 Tax=Acetomicrobium hydrogeniformans TaxID=649746 RepID=A0A7V6ZEE5_9BACT|nr:DNA-directed RNA polymerase subunit omega [Acetomicrobium hydrogeniformans]HHZ04449.1 DNA-directed RNA polymerase subunit omega [Acetomicrobium hydrogeniformans]